MSQLGNAAVKQMETIYADLNEEHEQIKDLLHKLKGLQDHLNLIPLLEELQTLLVEHFEREEINGGLYDTMGAHSDEYRVQLKVLQNEHFLMKSAVKGLVARARLMGADRVPEILREVAGLADSLGYHEQKESRFANQLRAD